MITKQGLDTTKNIRIFDDTGSGETYEVSKILYEDGNIIVGEASDEEMRTNTSSFWYGKTFKIMIDKESYEVISFDLNFYLAENY